MEINFLIVVLLVVLIAGIITLIIANHKFKSSVAFVTVLVISILTSILATDALLNEPITENYFLSGIIGNVTVRVDALSAWFILIINLTVINGILYGIGYLKSYSSLKTNLSIHWVILVLFHSSMLWVCMIENGLVFLVVWEIMSLSSLILIIFEYQNKSTLKAGINYMIQMHISVALLTVGFIWLYVQTGSFNFASLSTILGNNGSIWLLVLLLAGFAIKAGFIPFHSWLPHAHPAGPSHISGIMSGVIVKLGIYGIFRVITNLQSDYTLIGEIILIFAVISAIYGIANAAVNNDYKRMLAYCTIENIGIIGIGIGIGLIGKGIDNSTLMLLGYGGALLHTLNHSLYKSLLFFSTGNIYQQTHTRNIERLGGLIKKMPQTAIFFLIGGLAIGGLPPFNGFISEFIIYSGLVKSLSYINISQLILIVLSIAGLALAGGISILTFSKSFGVIFSGNPRQMNGHEPREVSLIMRIPQYAIIVIMITIAAIPAFYFNIVLKIVSLCINTGIDTYSALLVGKQVGYLGWANLLFLAVILTIIGIRWLTTRNKTSEIQPTWGCAYNTLIPKAQYTGNSFIKAFTGLFNFLILERKNYSNFGKSDLFPDKRTFSLSYLDLIEKLFINPIINRLRFSMNYFQFIQNGHIQLYVLYGILFMVLVFLVTLFGLI